MEFNNDEINVTIEQVEEILSGFTAEYKRTLEGLAMGEAFDVDEFFEN